MATMALGLLVVAAAAATAAAGTGGVIPVASRANATLYHVNERTAGPIPRNMDVSDLRGDMYFELHSLVLPLECATPPTVRKPFECENAEVVSPDLVVTALEVEVDARYGDYARCNVCLNHTDRGHPDPNCTDGASAAGAPALPPGRGRATGRRGRYVCDGGDAFRVGRANLTETVPYCESGDPDYVCWQKTAARKTAGFWFSTPAAGACDAVTAGAPCTWRVAQVAKVVNRTCAAAVRLGALEAFFPATFACPDSGLGPRRNASSRCWLTALFDAVLGPGCGDPDCAVAGMPEADLTRAWALPFADPADGGCAALPADARAP